MEVKVGQIRKWSSNNFIYEVAKIHSDNEMVDVKIIDKGSLTHWNNGDIIELFSDVQGIELDTYLPAYNSSLWRTLNS
jgi:hypothetical protein